MSNHINTTTKGAIIKSGIPREAILSPILTKAYMSRKWSTLSSKTLFENMKIAIATPLIWLVSVCGLVSKASNASANKWLQIKERLPEGFFRASIWSDHQRFWSPKRRSLFAL